MFVSLQWREWLRQVEVVRYEGPKSVVTIEDYLQDNLSDDYTAFVFDDTSRPMAQAIGDAWQARFSPKQLSEIYNALSPNGEPTKFKNKDAGFTAIALEVMKLAKEAVPYKVDPNYRSQFMQTAPNDGTTNANTTSATVDDEKTKAEAAAAADKAKKDAESEKQAKADAVARAKAEKEEAKAKAKAEKEAEKAKKAEAAAAAKAAAAAAKPKGVIQTLSELLQDGQKRTVDQLYDELAKRFPERGEAMKTTIRIQLVRLKSEGKLDVVSEDRHDADGKKLASKSYWGRPFPAKAA